MHAETQTSGGETLASSPAVAIVGDRRDPALRERMRGAIARALEPVLEALGGREARILSCRGDLPKVPSRGVLLWVLLEHEERLSLGVQSQLAAAEAAGTPVLRASALPTVAETAPAFHDLVANAAALLLRQSIELQRTIRRERGAAETVRRIDAELAEAARLQREFLPRRLPRHRLLECAVLWRPAWHVSGDTYDAIRLDRDRIGVFIADAVGHGLTAAIVAMGLSRRLQLFDERRERGPLEPAEVLRRLNDELVACRSELIWFATAAYAVFDLRRGEVTVASAGHPPPLLQRSGEAMRPLTTTGGLLGIFPNERFEQRTEILREDDRLLLHSDGFEQAFLDLDDPHADPHRGYLEAFEALRDCTSATAMAERIERRISSLRSRPGQSDDLTLLCTRFGSGAVAAVGGAAVQQAG